MARLWSVLGNRQRLDGGAMFGNAPRALWSRWLAPDEQHRVPLATRALLARLDDGRTVLCETGIGAFFDPALRDRYGVDEDRHVLLDSLADLGLRHEDIDVVVLSHLHFDHAGGLLAPFRAATPPELLFPRATFVVSAEHLARAQAPHPRDRASFVPGLVDLLVASGRLLVLDGTTTPLLPGWTLHRSEGHTPGLMLAEVPTDSGPVVFASDLIPGRAWVHQPVTMGYDRYPERLVEEKGALLQDLASRGGALFYTHDPDVALSRVARVEGRWTAVDAVAALAGWPA
jgi:glyoxylase-like metal-dependent hydrolase (beta-lactamase superfamily II)